MKKIYFFLNKGGTGRTSSVFNLSWVLSEQFKQRVLVVDMDAEHNISSLFNLDPDNRIPEEGYSIAHVLLKQLNPDGKRKPLKSCIEHIENSRIDVAVSSFDLSRANVFILNEINRVKLLANALKEVEDEYDYCLIDTGSANDQLFLNSIYAADIIVPTVKTNFLEVNNLSLLEATLSELKEEGIEPIMGGVLCTISDNTIHDRQCIDYIKDQGYNILGIVKKQIAIPDANLAGLPVFMFDKNKQAAIEYTEIAKKLMKL